MLASLLCLCARVVILMRKISIRWGSKGTCSQTNPTVPRGVGHDVVALIAGREHDSFQSVKLSGNPRVVVMGSCWRLRASANVLVSASMSSLSPLTVTLHGVMVSLAVDVHVA